MIINQVLLWVFTLTGAWRQHIFHPLTLGPCKGRDNQNNTKNKFNFYGLSGYPSFHTGVSHITREAHSPCPLHASRTKSIVNRMWVGGDVAHEGPLAPATRLPSIINKLYIFYIIF